MTADGILARGEANYKANKFLTNSETIAYAESLPKEEDKPKKEKEDGKPKSG